MLMPHTQKKKCCNSLMHLGTLYNMKLNGEKCKTRG